MDLFSEVRRTGQFTKLLRKLHWVEYFAGLIRFQTLDLGPEKAQDLEDNLCQQELARSETVRFLLVLPSPPVFSLPYCCMLEKSRSSLSY